MAEIITDPMAFKNGFNGLTNEEQFDAYYTPKNGQRANETNIGRAAKRNKKEMNIIRDYLAVLFNRQVRDWDITITYSYGEIVGVKIPGEYTTGDIYRYFTSVINDNFAVSPTGDSNLAGEAWTELDPMGTMYDTAGNDITAMNDVRLGANAHNSGYFIVGERLGNNIAMDRNEIMARKFDTNTGKTLASELIFQSDGGDVIVHNNAHLEGSGTAVIIKDSGKIGVGLLDPEADIHISGKNFLISSVDNPLYTLESGWNTDHYQIVSSGVDLHIDSSGKTFINKNGGNVNIGPDNGLDRKFNVSGTASIKDSTSATILEIKSTGSNSSVVIGGNFINATSNLSINKNGGQIKFHEDSTTSTDRVTISASGSLIIGKGDTASTYKLDMVGKSKFAGTAEFSDVDDAVVSVYSSSSASTISIGGDNIDATDELCLNQSGGDILFHNNSDDDSTKGTLTDAGSLVLGRPGSVTAYKLDVSGSALITNDLYVNNDVILGPDGNTKLTITQGDEFSINSTAELNIQDTKNLVVNETTRFESGKLGINTSPDKDLHIKGGTVRIQSSETTTNILDISAYKTNYKIKGSGATTDLYIDGGRDLYLSSTGGKVIIGAGTAENTVVQIDGSSSIRSQSEDTDVPVLTLVESGDKNKITISGSVINSLNDAAVSVLDLNTDGGMVRIHRDISGNKVTISNTGSLIIGRDTTTSDYKFDVKGKSSFDGEVYGIEFLELGSRTGSVCNTARTSFDDNGFGINVWTAESKDTEGTLYLQHNNGDTVVNHPDSDGIVHIKNNGYVGIRLKDPQYPLHVDGDAYITGKIKTDDDFILKDNLFLDGDTITTLGNTEVPTDKYTLYIQRNVPAKGDFSCKSGLTVIAADSDDDSETVRVSCQGKTRMGSTGFSSSERLGVVGTSRFYNVDPETNETFTSLSIQSSIDNVDLDLTTGAKLNIANGSTSNITTMHQGTGNTGYISIGGESILDRTSNDVNIANTSGFFRAEVQGPTLLTHYDSTGNNVNFGSDTEVLRIRHSSEVYTRFGGDYIQGVSGTDSASGGSLHSTARNSSNLRIQPNGGKVTLGDSTTSTTTVVMETKGKIKATTFEGTATSALYADIAERYRADAPYDMGTVLCVGGSEEVTLGNTSSPLAGVVSTQAAFRMNDAAHYVYQEFNVTKDSNTKFIIVGNSVDTPQEISAVLTSMLENITAPKLNINGSLVEIDTVVGSTVTIKSSVTAEYSKVSKGTDWPLVALKGRLPVKLSGTCTKGQYIVVDSGGKGKAQSTYPSNPMHFIGIALKDSYQVDIPNVDPTVTEYIDMVEVKV